MYGQARVTATAAVITKTMANSREKTSPCSACCCGICEKGKDRHGQRVNMERGIVTKIQSNSRTHLRHPQRSSWRSGQSGPAGHSTGETWSVGVGCAGGGGPSAGGDPVRGVGRTTGGIHIGGGDRLARAGCAGGGRWTA